MLSYPAGLNVYLNLRLIRIYYECEGRIDKIPPEDRRLASRDLSNDDKW